MSASPSTKPTISPWRERIASSAIQSRQRAPLLEQAEKRRTGRNRVVDRHVLYLGEINDSQCEAWLKSIEAFDEQRHEQRRLALFLADRRLPDHAQGARRTGSLIRSERLADSREGTS